MKNNTKGDLDMRKTILKYLLYVLSIFYLIGGIAHYFGLTIFPWYDKALYSPYHDSIIAMATIAMMIIIYIIATDIQKYKKLINGISLIALINGFLTIYMAYKVNFEIYNQNNKKLQAIIEGILLILASISLYFLNRKK